MGLTTKCPRLLSLCPGARTSGIHGRQNFIPYDRSTGSPNENGYCIYIYMYTVRRGETIPWMVALIGWRMATKKNLLLEEPPTRPTIDAAASFFFFFLFFFIISLSLFFFLFFLFFRLLFTRTIIVRRSMNSQPRKLARTFLFLRTNWERTRLILHCWASRA